MSKYRWTRFLQHLLRCIVKSSDEHIKLEERLRLWLWFVLPTTAGIGTIFTHLSVAWKMCVWALVALCWLLPAFWHSFVLFENSQTENAKLIQMLNDDKTPLAIEASCVGTKLSFGGRIAEVLWRRASGFEKYHGRIQIWNRSATNKATNVNVKLLDIRPLPDTLHIPFPLQLLPEHPNGNTVNPLDSSPFILFTVTRHDSGSLTVDFETGAKIESFRPDVIAGEDYPQQDQRFQQYCLKISASANKGSLVPATFKLIFTGQSKEPFVFKKN